MLVKLDDYITSKNHFKWKEALYLDSIKAYHSPSQQEIKNIVETCNKLDKFREYIGKPFSIHCWIRPSSVNDESGKHTGFDYNKLVKGAPLSSHITGLAVDFHIIGLSQDDAMKLILVRLKEFEMCSENNNSKNGRNWIHLQNRQVRGQWGINFDL